jgi:nitrite reductase/ring-hydroxylating ferredoxin subunit
MCSNVPLSLLSMIDSVKPMRTYLISAPVLKNSLEQCLWWDNNDPYHYVRVIPGEVHSNQDYVIIGGEDHVVGRDDGRSPEDRYRALETWGRERWPNIGPIHNRWSGQVEEPLDGIAYIGRNPHDYDNVFIVTGDSGMGLTHGTIGGEVICDLIDRKENKYAAIYDPGRLRLKSVPEYLSRNTATQFQFARYLAQSDVNDIEDIAPCSGAVMREGLRPVAVYKDEHGKIFKCSAICTHLKGVVRWNNDEKTWDCPVHGSRFKPHGQVVNGPAINPLPPIKD